MVFQEPIPPLHASSPLIKVGPLQSLPAVSDMELVLSPAPVLLGQQKILQQGLKDSNNLGGKASLWHSCCFLVSQPGQLLPVSTASFLRELMFAGAQDPALQWHWMEITGTGTGFMVPQVPICLTKKELKDNTAGDKILQYCP